MDYYQQNYNEILQLLEKNGGTIESKFIEEIFYAFQIASGQGFFNARMKAILDYFYKNELLIIEYPDKQIKIRCLSDLETCFQDFDDAFRIAELK